MNIENQYYNSKGLLETDAKEALEVRVRPECTLLCCACKPAVTVTRPAPAAAQSFKEVVAMEGEKGEWGFKAYKQIVKLQVRTRPAASARPTAGPSSAGPRCEAAPPPLPPASTARAHRHGRTRVDPPPPPPPNPRWAGGSSSRRSTTR